MIETVNGKVFYLDYLGDIATQYFNDYKEYLLSFGGALSQTDMMSSDNLNAFTKELQDFIESKGASIVGAVSGKTDLVIVSSIDAVKDNSKYKKAIELKIPIMTKGEFINKFIK